MSTQLFITDTQLVRNSIIDGSVDIDKYKQYIKIAQQIHIQNYLGTKLYDKLDSLIVSGDINTAQYLDYHNLLDDYIKPMLIHFAMVDYIPFAAFQISNGGVFKHRSENSEVATKDEVELLVQKHREFAQFYTRRFIDYMSFNQNLFPEYYAASNEDMYPDRDATFMGIVL
jgi:hypothetical protein